MTKAEQNESLTAAYEKMNDEGRDILDMAIQKLSKIHWVPQTIKKDTNSILNNQNLEGKKEL